MRVIGERDAAATQCSNVPAVADLQGATTDGGGAGVSVGARQNRGPPPD